MIYESAIKAKYPTIFTVIAYSLTVSILIFIFVENFVLGFDLGKISLRAIDDLAFQMSLQKHRSTITSLDLLGFLNFYDYGYGFIFWAPLTLGSLFTHFLGFQIGSEWPEIVFPRMASLAFGIGALIYIRKIFKLFPVSELLTSIGVLVACLLPTFGYFSGRFGTVNMLIFASLAASFYSFKYLKKQQNRSWPIFFLIGLIPGIKLSGILVLPIVLIPWAFRYFSDFTYSKLMKSILWFGFSGLVFVFSANPALFFTFSQPLLFVNYVSVIEHFVGITQLGMAIQFTPEGVAQGLFGSSGFAVAAVILLFGCTLAIFSSKISKTNKIFFSSVVTGNVLGSMYLLLKVNSSGSAVIYGTVLTVFLVFGIAGFESLKPYLAVGLSTFLVLFLAVESLLRLNAQFHSNEGSSTWNMASYFVSAKQNETKLLEADQISKAINLSSSNLKVVSDYSVPVAGNKLSHPDDCFSYVYDNLKNSILGCGDIPDYIILDTSRIGHSSDQFFDSFISKLTNSSEIKNYKEDRKIRAELEQTSQFEGHNYRLFQQIGQFIIFKVTKP